MSARGVTVSTRLVEANGAQVAPPIGDQRATLSTFHALAAADADHRRKYLVYATLAASLIVEVNA